LATELFDFGITPGGEAYAVPWNGPRHLAQPLRNPSGGQSIRQELAAAWFDKTGTTAPNQALADALTTLEGLAQRRPPTEAALRVASYGGAAWLDLGDQQGRVLRIGPDGWAVVTDAVPVLFRRTALTAPMPVPERAGTLDELWRFVNVAPADRPLVLSALVACLACPDQPQPIMALSGEPGTGKTTAAIRLASIVDASTVGPQAPPRDPDAWLDLAKSWRVIQLDNLSRMPEWLADMLCRAVTGDGFTRRKLYTDDGLVVQRFRRFVILTAVDLGALRADLNDRSLVVRLQPIPPARRATDQALAADWACAYPRVFGALADLAASVLHLMGSAECPVVADPPRMADFAKVLACVDAILGTSALAAYIAQSADLAAETIATSPFLAALTEAARPQMGTSAELLAALRPTEPDWREPRGWPKTSRQATTLLRHNAIALRYGGWQVDELPRGGHDKSVRWDIRPPSANPCAACGQPILPDLWAAGERTHATC
jgi:hypothetical protein